MRPVRVGELRELIEGPAFTGWWTELSRAAAAVGDARQREEDLTAQAQLMSARSDLARRAGEDASSRAEAARRGAERAAPARAVRSAAPPRRGRGAEPASGRRLERALLGVERRLEARRAEHDAERLLREAQERRARARQLSKDARAAGRERREAERRRAALLAAARRRFGCSAGELFLFWRDAADVRGAFAVALADDPDGSSPDVRALRIYTVSPGPGLPILEPVRPPVGRGVAEVGGE